VAGVQESKAKAYRTVELDQEGPLGLHHLGKQSQRQESISSLRTNILSNMLCVQDLSGDDAASSPATALTAQSVDLVHVVCCLSW
jgi:hypothetical protein